MPPFPWTGRDIANEPGALPSDGVAVP
jgi:hypothetical protein